MMTRAKSLILATAALAAVTPTAFGQFTNTNYPVPGTFKARAVQIVDQNTDGQRDLVFGASTSTVDRIYIRPGPGLGGPAIVQSYPASGLTDIEVAQFDNLQRDIASTHATTSVVRVRRFPGGVQTLGLPAGFNPQKVKSADLDNDDDLDLITVGWGNAQPRFAQNAGALFGAFNTVAALSVAPSRPQALGVGDFNHDGKVDLVVPRSDGNASYFRNTTVGATVSFAPAQTYANPNTRPWDVCVDDFNGDGWLDFATANSIGSASIYLNQGPPAGVWNTVNFTVSTVTIGTPNLLPRAITCGDYNCDGDVDLFLALAGTNQVAILSNNGAGSFTVLPLITVDQRPLDIDSGYIDGNNDHLDLATANFGPSAGPSTVTRLLNNSTLPPKMHVYVGGIGDNFATSTPSSTEHACPRPGAFATFAAPQRHFDQASCIREFGHTFPRRPMHQLPNRILKARLSIRLRADCSTSGDDTLAIGFRPAGNKLVFRKRIVDLPGVATYTSGTTLSLSFDLADLPGGINLLPKLNAERLLDVYVENGTRVDQVTLQIWTCERVRCLFAMKQTPYIAGNTWTSSVGGAPSGSFIFWFYSPTVGAGPITPAGQMCLAPPLFFFGSAFAPSGGASLSLPMPAVLPTPCLTISTQALSINFSTPMQWCLSNTWTSQLFN